MIGHAFEGLGDVVFVRHFGVADDLELGAVEVAQQGIQEVTRGVLAEVGREEADTDAAAGGRIVGIRHGRRHMRLGVGRIEALVFGEDLFALRSGW